MHYAAYPVLNCESFLVQLLDGLFGKEKGEKLESSLQRTEDQQSIDPVDSMGKAFLATLKEKYHLGAPKQIRDSKLFQGKSLDHMNEITKEMEATQKQRMTCKENIQKRSNNKMYLEAEKSDGNF